MAGITSANQEAEKENGRARLLNFSAIISKIKPNLNEASDRRKNKADEDSQEARDVLTSLLQSAPIARVLAKRRPNLSLRLLEIDLSPVFVFSKAYIEDLIDTPGSAWYTEFKASDNLNGTRFEIDPGGLLDDCSLTTGPAGARSER